MDEGSILLPLVLMFLGAVALGVLAVIGLIMSALRRGWLWLISIPIVLAVVVLQISSGAPLSAWIRYPAAIGIPLGIALPLVLPARPDSPFAEARDNDEVEARRNARALAFGWLAFALSLIWTWYLVMDPSCRLGHGGC